MTTFNFPQSQPLVKDCYFGVSPVNYSDQIKADIRKQHGFYVNNLVGDVKANHRDFYMYTNSQKKDTQGIPPLIKRKGSGVNQSEFEKADEFNGQFTDVFT